MVCPRDATLMHGPMPTQRRINEPADTHSLKQPNLEHHEGCVALEPGSTAAIVESLTSESQSSDRLLTNSKTGKSERYARMSSLVIGAWPVLYGIRARRCAASGAGLPRAAIHGEAERK
ncbi:hypothetical protein B0A48_04300 [Cryoendolithus antarcticus]|uniref:Uncharacterized protein n=1 Tax=Cryoendolithus antarcticus TaxID=1507870 RepID=A0A1V8TEZ8_9PEZI|nr:hypothetical protein B0A48_04300 [Cryoendolithus antarcticus]